MDHNKPKGTFAKLMSSTPLPPQEQETRIVKQSVAKRKKKETNYASTLASNQDSLQASKLSSTLALPVKALESIRKVVKNPGKEDVLYVRLTKEEKDSLADVSYTYKRRGIKTSDNELVRIAINALLEEYKINGKNSLLATIIASLHA